MGGLDLEELSQGISVTVILKDLAHGLHSFTHCDSGHSDWSEAITSALGALSVTPPGRTGL